MIRKIIRYTLTTVAAVLVLIILVWVILLIYVNANEKSLINKATAVVEKRIRGDVHIGGLSVSFFRTFPLLSLQLEDVELNDSLYYKHQRHLLKASDIYLRASIPGLITNTDPVDRVIIRNGEINVLTDSAGSNEYVLKSGNRKPGERFSMPDVVLQSVDVNYEDVTRKKHYYGHISSLKCNTVVKKERIVFRINLRMLVKNLSFNTKLGSYLTDKPVTGKFDLAYLPASKDVLADHVTLTLDGHAYEFEGKFNTDKSNGDFHLNIKGKNVKYSHATSLLTQILRKKLDEYSISEPMTFEVRLLGKTTNGSMPLIEAFMDVKNNRVGTPKGTFDRCSFKGRYLNEKVKGKKRTDENSILEFKDFSGTWENIVIHSKNILISNLTTPFLECDVVADADMESLNGLAGSSSLHFKKGKLAMNVLYRGSVMGKDSTAANINGTVSFRGAALKYIPRNVSFDDCNGNLKFVNNDLLVNRISATAGKTKLVMTGSAKNFLSLLDVSPEKLIVDWKISSPFLHLQDFKGFLSKAQSKKRTAKNAQFGSTASKIDKMFTEGDMNIQLDAPLMDYKTFQAQNVIAKVVLSMDAMTFEKVNLNHAKGSMEVKGSLKNGAESNPVQLNAVLRDMDVPLLFTAFNNFGQDAVTSENIKGKISANVNFNTAVNNQAQLISQASEGSVFFLLENGELNNFQPLLEVSKKAFKKQDFSHILFADLKNRLDIKGTAFIVNPMEIRSTALNFTVEGVYDIKKGTDMSIRFPLNNLTRSQASTDISEGGKIKKGVSLRLRARTGADGKLKVSWDPFKKALKNKEDVKDSAEAKS